MKAYRSKRYCQFLIDTVRACQRSGITDAKLDLSHPSRRRPWIGKVGETFSPGKEKGSDYGCLILSHGVNLGESDGGIHWKEIGGLSERDIISVGNLVAYAEHLDPGTDLWAEGVEWMQARVKELEDGELSE